MKLPNNDPRRPDAMDAGLRKAIEVPLKLARHVDALWDVLIRLASVGNINCKSDLQVRYSTRSLAPFALFAISYSVSM